MRLAQRVAALAFLITSATQLSAGSPEKARTAFLQGQTLLAEGDFGGALGAFKAAAKGQRSNEEYTQQYALLRQVVKLRKELPKEKNHEQWLAGAAALHTFYHEQKLFAQSLPLDEERFHREPSVDSVVLLAQTQIVLNMNSQVVELIAGLPCQMRTPHVQILHGLALARVGRLDEARSIIASQSDLNESAGPEPLLDLARVYALVGEPPGALRSLKRSFELTPPSRLEEVKSRIAKSRDFTALAATAEFAEVMKTSSTVPESPCSGGSGCSKCPKRAKCGSTKPTQAPEKP